MIHLLLVDDDPLIRLAAGAVLRADGGFAVREAATAADALREAAAGPLDVLLTDVQLPDLDGPELVARLKDRAATRDVPVVFLTAASAATADGLRAGGARGVITKPFDPLVLADTIRGLLGE